MRLHKYIAAFPLLFLVALPAAAETVVCADANRTATAEVEIVFTDGSRDAGQVLRVAARFDGHSVATEPADSDRGPEVLFDPIVTHDRLEVFLVGPDQVRIVFALRLLRDFRYDGTDRDYEEHVVAGTMRMMGAGVWAVTCTGW